MVDADIYGYSIPRMLGITRRPVVVDSMIVPPVNHGLRIMSIGFFLEPDQAVVWRGPMLHKALEQFLTDVHWGDLDYLIVDMPPGTGDVSISLGQLLPSPDVVIVTTPQAAAQQVAERSAEVAGKTGMHVAGVIENMSYLVCPCCGERSHVFGEGGGRALADRLGVPLLGEIPLDEPLRIASDAGRPLVLDQPDAASARGDRRDRRRAARGAAAAQRRRAHRSPPERSLIEHVAIWRGRARLRGVLGRALPTAVCVVVLAAIGRCRCIRDDRHRDPESAVPRAGQHHARHTRPWARRSSPTSASGT